MALATTKARKDNAGLPDGAVRESVIQLNTALTDIASVETLINQLRSYALTRALGSAGLVIVTNFDVKNGSAISYQIAGQIYALGVNTACDTGTAATFPAAKWGVFLVSANTSAALTATWATNASAGYATEAAAIAALPAVPANECEIGYVTVQAHASNSFTAGTDALTTGTGGNVAAATNYYNHTNGNAAIIGAALSLTAAKVGNREGVAITA